MTKKNDHQEMIGTKFGRLTVFEKSEKPLHVKENRDYWKCICDCGKNNIIVMGKNLRRGMTQSCGCLQHEKMLESCRKYNKFNLSNDYGIGYDHRNNMFYFDLEDFDKIKNYYWQKSEWGYFYFKTSGTQTFMQDFLLNNKNKEIIIDHINRVRNDNRKDNLRPVTYQQNTWNKNLLSNNTSGIMGISFSKQYGCWDVYLAKNGKRIFRKKFWNLNDAIVARLQQEKKHYGEFAPQRHLFEQYGII